LSAAPARLAGTRRSEPPPPDGVRLNGPGAGGDSVGQAAERVVDAARGLVLDHLALALLETKLVARGLLQAAALGIAGALFLAATWGLTLATAYHAVGDGVAPWIRLAALTAGTGLVGVILVVAAARQVRA